MSCLSTGAPQTVAIRMLELTASVLLGFAIPKEVLRFQFVLEQQSDSSCGLAAVASLLSLYRGIQVEESDLAMEIPTRQKGRVNLSNLKQLVEERGIGARGYRMDYEQITEAAGAFPPLLAHYYSPHPHFVLVLAVLREWVAVADPSTGMELVSAEEFSRRWSGAVLVSAFSPENLGENAVSEAACAASERMQNLIRWTW